LRCIAGIAGIVGLDIDGIDGIFGIEGIFGTYFLGVSNPRSQSFNSDPLSVGIFGILTGLEILGNFIEGVEIVICGIRGIFIGELIAGILIVFLTSFGQQRKLIIQYQIAASLTYIAYVHDFKFCI